MPDAFMAVISMSAESLEKLMTAAINVAMGIARGRKGRYEIEQELEDLQCAHPLPHYHLHYLEHPPHEEDKEEDGKDQEKGAENLLQNVPVEDLHHGYPSYFIVGSFARCPQ
jgi:hypothetical protein